MDYIFVSSLRSSGITDSATASALNADPFTPTTMLVDPPPVASSFIPLSHTLIVAFFLSIIASYDIACQWLKHLFERLERLPPHLVIPLTPEQVQAKIPKFHFDAHGKKNHAQYSFNFTKGAGQNEGEGVERNWSYAKAGAGQTVEMGPGGRHDVLDDFFGYCNYRKMTDIGKFCACHAF